MAPKTAALPAASSSSSSSGEEDEDIQMPPPPKKPVEESSEGDDDSSASTDDDSASSDSDDADPAPPRPPTKPHVSSPNKSSSNHIPSPNKSSADAAAAADKKNKRKALGTPPPLETAAAAADKKNKALGTPPPLETASAAGGQKRPRFQRIWSDEDEVALLNGMLNHKIKNGNFPTQTDMKTFCDIINKDLTSNVNKSQLYEKIRRIKAKYKAAAAAAGKAPTTSSTKPHDTEIFKLAHKLWAEEDGNGAVGPKAGGESAKKGGKKFEGEKKKAVAPTAADNVKPGYTFLKHAVTQMADCLPNHVDLEEVLDFVDDSKATTIEEKMKMLWNRKQKHQMREIDLNKEAKKMILEALDKMA